MSDARTNAPLTLCECGCGTAVPNVTSKGSERRFAMGHNRRRSVRAYCAGTLVPVYIHEEFAHCSGCRSEVAAIY